MAKKQKEIIRNSRPRHNWDTDQLSKTEQSGSSSATPESSSCAAPGSVGGRERTVSGLVKHSIHEVGQNGSSFPGTDSYGRDMKGATFATREKLYHRYDLIEGISDSGILDEDGFPIDSDIELRQYVYDNPTLERRSTKSSGDFQTRLLRKEEDQTVLLSGYDEKYFQHIFSWPTSHTLRSRKIAGFIERTTTISTSDDDPGCDTTSTSYEIFPQEQTYDVNFTLTDVTAEIYQPNPESGSKKGDKVWNYNPLVFDPITGKLQNKDTDIRDKLGDPIIYYGDHSSDAIFFNYVPDSSIVTTIVTHDFDDDANKDNSFTTTGSINVVPKNRGDKGGSDNSKNRKHYDITFPRDIVNTGDIRIHFNQKKTASGISRERLFVSKLKQVGDKKIRVWLQTETGGNTFARNWTVSMGGGETGAVNVIGIGDTVNGATVSNVVNYVEEVALLRMVTRQPNKGVEDKKITEAQFLALTNPDGSSQGLDVGDYAGTRAWLKLNDTRDLVKGMNVQGHGIKFKTTTITGVDYNKNIVYITDTIKDKKLKNVKFIDKACNRVSKHTLCYATLSGTVSNFSADTEYDVSRNGQNVCRIAVKAGKGIINKSAVVGTWFSEVKHEIDYQPVFYGANFACEREIDSDEYGEYTLGTIIWNDNSRLEGKYFLTNPTSNFAYTVSSIWFSFTYAPIDQTTLYVIKDLFDIKVPPAQQTMDSNDRYEIFIIVSDLYKEFNLKAAAAFDDICRDDIKPNYFNIYDPIEEQQFLKTNTDTVSQTIIDVCSVQNEILTQQSIDQSYVLPQLYKEKFDKLIGDLREGYKLVEGARPTVKIENLPPQIVGEDQSGRIFKASSFRDLPPRTDRVGYFCNDLIVTEDKYLNPILDLDPQTTVNQPKIIIRSKPRWVASNTGNTWPITIPSDAGDLTTSMNVTVNNSNGHVGNITTSAGPVSTQPPVVTLLGSVTTTTTCSIAWVPLSDVNAKENAQWFTRDAFPDVYTISTNVALPPGGNHNDTYAKTDLRDLLYKERPKDANDEYINDMLTAPSHVIYPAVVWEPAVNYQQDFHKTLEFRLQEHSELIGETIENKGNPYVDNPIVAKLTKKLEISDTSILVDSTGEFLSSGYLIIPKYIKKIASLESGNTNGFYTYSGEEIIYYGSKTETSFDNIQRGMFNTTSGFEDTISVESIEKGVKYKITSLGSSNWKKIGAGKNAKVGDIFTATDDGVGTGTVTGFGTTNDETPDETLIAGVIKIPKEAVITSYDRGFSLAQHSAFSLKY